MSSSNDTHRKPSRRIFLGTAACLPLAAGTLATSGCGSVPEVEFPAGSESDIPAGSRKFLEDENVWLVHGDQGFAAISAICTHLGCRISESEAHDGYHCGCHDSEFDARGSVLEGPADQPLDWYGVRREDGKLFVDGRKTVPAGTWS